jgi:hypothetical protein
LEPLGISDNFKVGKLLFEEFITGSPPGTNTLLQRTQAEKDILNQIYKNLNKTYGWNDTQYFGKIAGQNCSDMLVQVGEISGDLANVKLSRCASCVARCIPPCDLCAYFRNPQGQTISSWILVYLCVCPTISTALKVVSPKKY